MYRDVYPFVLDGIFRQNVMIDDYISLVWTERYYGWSEFILEMDGYANEPRFSIGSYISVKNSDLVMMVETCEEKLNENGRLTRLWKGRDLTAVWLESRSTYGDAIYNGRTFQNVAFDIISTAGYMKKIVDDNIINAKIQDDRIPELTSSRISPFGEYKNTGTMGSPTAQMTITPRVGSCYQQIKDISEGSDIGFKIVRLSQDLPQFEFLVYSGTDKTSAEGVHNKENPVRFSPMNGTISSLRSIRTISQSKNVAYVFGKHASRVYENPPTQTGKNRRVLAVDASDIDMPVDQNYFNALIFRGRVALASYRPMVAIDGETTTELNQFYYGDWRGLRALPPYARGYGLGDYVEMQDHLGNINVCLVTEFTATMDADGLKTYPTLSIVA